MSARHSTRKQQAKQAQKQQTVILFVIGLGLILIAIAALAALPNAQKQAASLEPSAVPVSVNFPAPDVQLTSLDGQPVALSDFHGQVVLYNAWATWCPPCKQEMPTLQAYYEKHRKAGFVIIAIEDGQPIEKVRDFVDEYRLTFPVWPDPQYTASNAFRVNGLPTSFVIDRNGIVRLTWTGAISHAMLEEYVTPLLKQ